MRRTAFTPPLRAAPHHRNAGVAQAEWPHAPAPAFTVLAIGSNVKVCIVVSGRW